MSPATQRIPMFHALLAILAAVLLCTVPSQPANAASTEEMFQEVFITAGYATAFGAALGAASLSLYENPQRHLQAIAIGASMGFIGGSILGSYLVLAPVITQDGAPASSHLASHKSRKFQVAPILESESMTLTGMYGSWNIADF